MPRTSEHARVLWAVAGQGLEARLSAGRVSVVPVDSATRGVGREGRAERAKRVSSARSPAAASWPALERGDQAVPVVRERHEREVGAGAPAESSPGIVAIRP